MPNTAVKLLSAECSWGLPPVRLGRCRAIFGELAQLGERLPYKQDVGGSNPSFSITYDSLAQSVERRLGKAEVVGSNPICSFI